MFFENTLFYVMHFRIIHSLLIYTHQKYKYVTKKNLSVVKNDFVFNDGNNDTNRLHRDRLFVA